MTATVLHFQLRPWTPRRFASDVRQALIALSYQFPVVVEFFEDHNSDQSARLAPTSDSGSSWLVMTADSRGTAVLAADATPLGVFSSGVELRAALLPVVGALSRSSGAATGRAFAVDRRVGGAEVPGSAEIGQPTSFARARALRTAPALDDASCPTMPA